VGRRRCAWSVTLGALVATLVGAPAASAYDATIRRDPHGIPQITGKSWGDVGYGYGYAIAADNVCELAETYATVRAERSRFFGPDGSYTTRGNGATHNNLNSDFFYQRAIDDRLVERLLERRAPQGPRPEIREGVRGYVAGYNAYLRRTGVDRLPDPRCRGKGWVRPITALDAYRRFWQLGLLASQGVVVDSIGSAQPPPPGATGGPPPVSARTLLELKDRLKLDIGSNAYGIGSEQTEGGGGLVLGNPHFPWDGPERFYQARLTIPGKLNVSGCSLFGVPVVLIGATNRFAWSHTVSTAYRFTPFEVKLVPGSPTTYLVDGRPKAMERDEVTVRLANGEQRRRTLYSTEHGSVFTSILGLPIFPWTPTSAYAMGDANAGNFRYLNHFFETNLAQSVREYDRILRRNQGIPWVNSIAADASGEVYYADLSVVPNVPDDKARLCGTALGQASFQTLRLPVLDGSRSSCRWSSDPDAVEPGIFGPRNLPSMFRRDYVMNGNDSYWLSNHRQRLEGFNRIIGDERTQRTLRTRLGLKMAMDRRFSLGELQETVFNNRQYAGELWRDELVEACERQPLMLGSSGPVDVSAACPVLRRWNLRDDLDSSGAILFRRFAGRALASVGGVVADPTVFDVPFSAANPVETPRGLRTENPKVQQALADSVKELRDGGIPLDAPLRGWQYEERNGERIPIHGGPGGLGVFNAINVSFAQGKGYPNVSHGSSFVQAVQLRGRCPEQRTILTYSQSTDPTSPHFADQTRMFSAKRWVRVPMCGDFPGRPQRVSEH
jgi:acyl-homoserine-lactone acylase